MLKVTTFHQIFKIGITVIGISEAFDELNMFLITALQNHRNINKITLKIYQHLLISMQLNLPTQIFRWYFDEQYLNQKVCHGFLDIIKVF